MAKPKLVEENLTDFRYDRLKALRPAMEERNELLNEHVCKGNAAHNTLEELNRLIDCGVVAPKEAVNNTRAMLREYMAKITVMKTEYIWEMDRSTSLDTKWQSVEKLIDKCVSEIETMLPSSKFDASKVVLHEDPDLLMIHIQRYVQQLEAELKAAAQAASERVTRGVETLPHDKKTRDILIQNEYKKKQLEMEQFLKKRIDRQKADFEKALQAAQKKLKERHENNMEKRLQEKEVEANKLLDQMVKDAVEAQKRQFARELADMSRKVQAVEINLEARLKAEREVKRSQQLWSAGASLLNATRKGDHHIRVDKEIKAIENAAGDGDKLVETVIKAIPDQVRKEGIVPESVLRERYRTMEQTALSVALVELEGSAMPVYFMSWIQSLLLYMRLPGIPQKDIDKPFKDPKELEDLDTFDRLNYARYWVQRGNLAPALRYIESLDGASRVAADAWYRDAKSHMEIRQAAEAVIAHATAMALQFV